jgi:TPR repeat protein
MPRENAFAIVDRLLRLANELVVSGNAPAARLILKEAADAGYASAALAMGSTFDPFEIGKLNEHEVTPDVPLARMWYERADRLGSPEALDRLKRLQSAN